MTLGRAVSDCVGLGEVERLCVGEARDDVTDGARDCVVVKERVEV